MPARGETLDRLQWIGRSLPRADARDKVTGTARYGTDLQQNPFKP